MWGKKKIAIIKYTSSGAFLSAQIHEHKQQADFRTQTILADFQGKLLRIAEAENDNDDDQVIKLDQTDDKINTIIFSKTIVFPNHWWTYYFRYCRDKICFYSRDPSTKLNYISILNVNELEMSETQIISLE